MGLRVAPEAEFDLNDIWDYIAGESGSVQAADRIIDSLTVHFYLLSRNPYIGRRRDEDIQPGLRSFPSGRYIIFYRVAADDVAVLRVLAASRDLLAALHL